MFISHKRIVSLLLGTLIAFSSASVFAQAFKYQWNIREIVAADSDLVELRTRNRLLLKKVSSSQMRIIYAVKSSIEQVAELSTELIIVDGDQANAFAGRAKSGANIIGINFAMLDLLDDDVHAIAALIGHEIAHLKLNHGAESAKNKSTSRFMNVFGGVALGSLGVPAGGLISDIAITAVETNYSRENEREADYLGAIWAVEADFDSAGAARLHESLYERSKHLPSPFLSSHPSGPERIENLRSLSRRLSP